MILHQFEYETFKAYEEKNLGAYPTFTLEQDNLIKDQIIRIRSLSRSNRYLHLFLQLIPLLSLFSLWFLTLNFLPAFFTNTVIQVSLVALCLGFIGYSFVIYTLHEGAGHGLFRTYPKLKLIAFNLPRLKMADPQYYQNCHQKHHKHLGKEEDCAFTNFISLNRFLRSVVPGAGIFFPNDYNIHQNPVRTKSRTITEITGLIVILIELKLLQSHFSLINSLLIVCLLAPWFGMVFDRIRETTEHRFMPAHNLYGTKELGIGIFAQVIGGGPWGQPCHFSHHLAPDLTWYQQVMLHLSLRKIMNKKQKDFFFFNIREYYQ